MSAFQVGAALLHAFAIVGHVMAVGYHVRRVRL
jgi:hypothetical protein